MNVAGYFVYQNEKILVQGSDINISEVPPSALLFRSPDMTREIQSNLSFLFLSNRLGTGVGRVKLRVAEDFNLKEPSKCKGLLPYSM